MINYIALSELIKLKDSDEISQDYIAYLCGFSRDHNYRHQEIIDISLLLENFNNLEINDKKFLYGYSIPQLSKEFDLLIFANEFCVNIELKSTYLNIDNAKKQLIENQHYLKMIKGKIYSFTYYSTDNKLFILDEKKELRDVSFECLENLLGGINEVQPNLDEYFLPRKILVSPLNSPSEFLRGNYILTENQRNIKEKIINFILCNNDDYFYGLYGSAGTGKTLLIYDIVKELSKSNKIILVHSGMLCDGHDYLNSKMKNVNILKAKDLRYREIKDIDLLVVDESHRLYETALDKIKRWSLKANKKCIFTYDEKQKMSYAERRRNTMATIKTLCGINISKLTNKIRTNKEIAMFITCLRDLSKYKKEYRFPNVKIVYEKNKNTAVKIAKQSENPRLS